MKEFHPSHCHDLSFGEAIVRWDEALPLGAGRMGCLLWGDGAPLRFSLDRGDLWDTRPNTGTMDEDYTYDELVRLVKEDKAEELHRRFIRFGGCVTPTKIPAGRVLLDFGKAAQRVESHLSLARAEAKVSLSFEGEFVTVSSFVHATRTYGFMKIAGGKPKLLLQPHDFTAFSEEEKAKAKPNHLRRLSYPPVERFTMDGVEVALQKTVSDGAFALMAASGEREGKTEVVFFVANSREGENWLEKAVKNLREALEQGYDRALTEHLSYWDSYWEKSRISLPDKLLEKHWYLANYYFASTSRKGCPPLPLQGVWTEDLGNLPPWRGDYHGDLNTEFSYYHFLKADRLEEGESFVDFMVDLGEKCKDFTRRFHKTEGICIPSSYSLEGQPIGGWAQYSYSFTNQIWQLHPLYLYYQYTGDERFAKERLYPLLEGIEKVVARYLKQEQDGSWHLPLSTSPEIGEDSKEAWFSDLTNYDLSLIRFLYEALIELSSLAGKKAEPWQRIYERLPLPAVDEKEGYQLSPSRRLEHTHRHFSHLMAIYPLNQCHYHRSEAEKKIVEDSIAHLEKLGRDRWIGFSFAWMANLYAKAMRGEEAQRELTLFYRHLCSPNGFHLNGDFRRSGLTLYRMRTFTLESNLEGASALQEMLLQCYDGVIRLFPAIPAEWREQGCEFEGFLSFGGVKVSSAIRKGKIESLSLVPKRDTRCRLYPPFEGNGVKITCEDDTWQKTAENGIITLELKKGKHYQLSSLA